MSATTDRHALRVRPASADDVRGVAEVHVQAWREAYARQLPADLLAGLRVEPRVERWAAIIADDVTDVHVAELDGRIVGWATASDGRDHDRPVRRELEGIYVLAAFYGTGAGQLLMDAAVGADDAYLWMMDDNPRAEAFYRRNGFERDGVERERRLAGHPIQVVRLVRHDGVSRWAAVKDAEVALLEPQVRRDAARVDELLHPTFVEIGRSGILWTREQVVTALAEESEGARVAPQTDQWEFRHPSPDLVLVTYRLEAPSGRSRHSSLWDIAGDTPRLRFHQGTVVPPARDFAP
ncbi:GNAT family N-acetyltransferase [Microbacterium sp. VKM Ac-2870]|uniref:GNAT family N-acetyltransferase n=1 Tax=Microbacterium sp. VKM Ac-2870 TaxID=2783825 RepID=UPI00188AE57D|nr:GNAT family N-acetyltransferase [Microbacterium sp. VKM Ac-2870]MBF4562525.1 GNAT family N-acetyltransferase [Microbacterium sp. VKM Ac-2870]